MTRPTSETPTRLSKEGRREQLLDVTAELLVEHGPNAVTIERLAEWAGVSKALPYSHFDNAEDALHALRDRENTRVATVVLDGLADLTGDDDPVERLVTAFFDAVADRADLLALLTGPGAVIASPDDAQHRVGPLFVTHLLTDHLGVSPDRARPAATVVLSTLIGCVDAWTAGDASRRTMEGIGIDVVRAAIGAGSAP
jgi:AcrR family transcriptional regulator